MKNDLKQKTDNKNVKKTLNEIEKHIEKEKQLIKELEKEKEIVRKLEKEKEKEKQKELEKEKEIEKQKEIEKDKKYKIVISIFSENRDLISTCEGLKDDIDKEENNEKKFFLRNIGFCPEDKIDKFKVEYKLYDPEEQLLTYHLFFNISKEIKISKSILLVEFVKTNVNIAIYYKSEIIKKLKGKEINFKDLNFDKIDEILDLIKNVSDNYEGIELVLSIDNNLDEENKKKLSESIEKVKTFCHEKVYPPMKIYEYEQNDVLPNVIKYTNSIYEI